ncbi:helix-turn-helix transcriptional regulator [Streptomyces sp. HUAS MG91]|uniref:Helix-turn-helix transcriptional regulator n=1 Tax=Streptomyces tabacisoli TaxID=3156398 RepID=A0AAU8ITF8_9ACTN
MPRSQKQSTSGVSPQKWFGEELRRLRRCSGMSAKALGKLVQVSEDVIYSVETGKYPSCRLDLAKGLDEVFETGGLFERSWPMAFRPADSDKKAPDSEKAAPERVKAPVQVHEGRILGRGSSTPPSESLDPVDRRALLLGGLAALAPLDLVSLVTPAAQPEVPMEIRAREIALLEQAADHIHTLDNAHGGGGLVTEIANRSLTWAVCLLPVKCPEPLRPQLLSAVARLGLVVGATQFDAYAHDDARVSFRLAAECAEEGKNWHLRAKTYSFMARQAIWKGDPDTGLTDAEKGLVRSDRITPTERAMLHTARARAFGKMGDVSNTLMAVGDADAAFDQSDPAQDPPWMAYYDHAQHHGDTAHALYDLAIRAGQDPGRAAERFEVAVEGHGKAFARSRAISRTKWASLIMAKGDPRQAIALGHRALDEVGKLTSRRAADDLRELSRYAARHRSISEAADLRERIATTVPS